MLTSGITAHASVNPDYCPELEKENKQKSQLIEEGVKGTIDKWERWGKDPTQLPPKILLAYRAVIRLAAYTEWTKTATAGELTKAWLSLDPKSDVKKKFFATIYKKQVSSDQEKKFAYTLFQLDYKQNIKPKLDIEAADVRQKLQDNKKELDEGCSPDVLSQVLRGTIGRAILTYNRNKDAAENEKGDIAYEVRRWTGISLTDIAKYGLRGGENSELSKLGKAWTAGLDSIGIGENHFLREAARALDVTNMKVPKGLQVTIDDDSVDNTLKNLNPFRWTGW